MNKPIGNEPDVSDYSRHQPILIDAGELDSKLDAIPAAAYTCDLNGLITGFNANALRLWGRAPRLNDARDRFCGAYRLFSLDGQRIPHADCAMATTLLRGEDQQAEVVIQHEDGTLIHALARIVPIRDTAGNLVGALNTLVDATDRHQAERLLRESQRPVQLFLSEIRISAGLVDRAGNERSSCESSQAFEASQFEPESNSRQASRETSESPKRLHGQANSLFAESSPSYSFEFTVDDRRQLNLSWISGQFTEVTGYQAEEVIGGNWVKLVPQNLFPRVREFIEGITLTPTPPPSSLESQILTRTGETRWIRCTLHPVPPARCGEPMTVFGSVLDVTERRQCAMALQEREEYLRAIVETSPACIKVIDAKGRMVDINAAGLALLEITDLNSVRGVCVYEFITEPYRQAFRDYNESICQGARGSLEFQIVTARGNLREMESFSAPLRGTDGLLNHLAITVDVTQQKQWEAFQRKSDLQLRAFFSQTMDGCFCMMLDEPVKWDEFVDKEAVLDYVFAHQRMVQFNDAMLEQYRAKRQQLLNITPQELFRHDLEHGRNLWRQLFDAGKIRLESFEQRSDGSPMLVEGDYIVFYDDDGRITGHFGIQRDITERRSAQNVIQQTNELLETISLIQRQFLVGDDDLRSFEQILAVLLEWTSSEGGFVAAILNRTDKSALLQNFASTNLDWNRDVFQTDLAAEGYEIDLDETDSWIRALLDNARPLLVNSPELVDRAVGLPLRGQPISAFLGVPLIHGDELIGVVGLANRAGGYDTALIRNLNPVFSACSSLMYAYRVDRQRERAETALRESQERLLSVIRHTPNVAIQWYDSDGRVVLWNEASEAVFGFSAAEAVGKTLDQLIHTPNETVAFREMLVTIAQTGQAIGPSEYHFRRRNGQPGVCLSSIFKIPGDGQKDWFVCMDVDITERKRAEEDRCKLEAQILHTQKLESLGVLAGGIAHDFNNLLTAILGNTKLALMQRHEESSTVFMLQEIEKAAHRAAELTQQMLAYSGRGTFVIQRLRLDRLVHEMTELLKSVVSKKATIVLELQPAMIEADATQIRQVVMNLITNASDALAGQNGTIQIRTGVRHADEAYLSSPYLSEQAAPGQYAFVEVEDNGCGMSDETLAKIFDPFFSTKFTGRGLGLAAVLGIVRAHQGAIKVISDAGQGTQFEVLIPKSAARPLERYDQIPNSAAEKGQGTILIIEDEPSVRNFTCLALTKAGFDVCTAVDGESGLELLRTRQAEIVAILLDLTMPRMDGLEVLRQIHGFAPHIPALVMSGYGKEEIAKRVTGLAVGGIIQKPFLPQELIGRICRMISRDPPIV